MLRHKQINIIIEESSEMTEFSKLNKEMFMKNKHARWGFLVFLSIILLLSACSGGNGKDKSDSSAGDGKSYD